MSGPPPLSFAESPLPEGGDFGSSAASLAGLAGILFGWWPEEFWRATPEELAALLRAMTPQLGEPVDLAKLMEQFPDG